MTDETVERFEAQVLEITVRAGDQGLVRAGQIAGDGTSYEEKGRAPAG